MSGIMNLQLSGVLTYLVLTAAVAGGWVLVTQGLKIRRLERQAGGARPPQQELRKLRILFSQFHHDHVALNGHLVEALAEVESTTADLDNRLRTLSRRLDRFGQDLAGKLERDEADAIELRTLQALVQSLPKDLADHLERNDHRHRRTTRGTTTRRPGDSHDDEPLSFPQPA